MKFFHFNANQTLRLKNNTGGVTLAYSYNKETSTLLYSVAYCNSKDQYNKRIGRDISTARFLDGELNTFRTKNVKHSQLEDIAWLHYSLNK